MAKTPANETKNETDNPTAGNGSHASSGGTATITVTSRQPSRWRAGMQFTSEPVTVAVTPSQLAAIKADPQLVIIETATAS